MKKKLIYELKSLYRDSLRVYAYEFGEGEESICIVGALRGNEVQQMYICSLLIERLKIYEQNNCITKNKKIVIIPCVNTYSMNQGKRFWPQDDTDINRMFPGYYAGETTQRIAESIFDAVKNFPYGIQFTSFYIPGQFSTHIRMMKTGLEDIENSKLFGLPYIIVRAPRPYDTTTLNYNWQIWNCKAYSLYTKACDFIDKPSAQEACRSVLRFMYEKKITSLPVPGGFHSEIIEEDRMISVKSKTTGFMERLVAVNEEVYKGEILARIYDPYEHTIIEELCAPYNGTVFFVHAKDIVYAHTSVVKLKINKI